MKRLISLFLALLTLAAPAAAWADKADEPAEARGIYTAEQFVEFAKNCAVESYSAGKSFVLKNDLDLSGLDYEPAGYFAGSFDGGGHVIRGLDIDRDGSRLGLFRRVAPGAEIRDLRVEGAVRPGGSRQYIGGIAGFNEGRLLRCVFSGEVRGIDCVGGVAGFSSGSVEDCAFSGAVVGEHRVGGVAGSNSGIVSGCENSGSVNAEAVTPVGEPRFDLSAVSQDDFVDISDIGGITGLNDGAVTDCRSRGAVGYRLTGYNVGGVAGKSAGYVSGCVNDGPVEGRRDVGGIVGQLIPYASWELSESKLEELRRAIAGMNSLLGAARTNMDGNSALVRQYLGEMSKYTGDATAALTQIIDSSAGQERAFIDGISVDPETGAITLPSARPGSVDTSALSAALNNMYAQSAAMTGALSGTVGDAAEDFGRIAGQMSYIFNILYSIANESSNGLVTTSDLSYTELYEHSSGAVADCVNRGAVRADNNAGGIVGTAAFEVEFDMEDSLGASELLPTHADCFLFAAVRGCESGADVSVRGDAAGGIIGSMDVGAVADCVSAGTVASQSGGYVGGVAGKTKGTLARCWSRCSLEGGAYVGGTAGLGAAIYDCRSWVHIERGTEYLGAVAGWAEGEVSGCVYVAGRPDGVDGVSLTGQCESVSAEAFMALEGAPAGLETVTLRFMAGDRLVESVELPFGSAVGELPEVPEKDGAYWVWDDFDREHVYASAEIHGGYRRADTVLSSGEEVPLFLVEGEFGEGQSLLMLPGGEEPEGAVCLGSYTLSVPGCDGELKVRMRCEGSSVIVVRGADGEWRELDAEWDGQYLVFELPNGGSFAVTEKPARAGYVRYAAIGGGVLAAALLAFALAKKRKKK